MQPLCSLDLIILLHVSAYRGLCEYNSLQVDSATMVIQYCQHSKYIKPKLELMKVTLFLTIINKAACHEEELGKWTYSFTHS
jgi:hypothetical protein